MSMSSGAKMQIEAGSFVEAVHDIYIGFVVGVAHSWYFVDKFFREQIFQPLTSAFGIETSIEGIPEEKEKTLKVVGVGYGRTGTVSRIHTLPIIIMVVVTKGYSRVAKNQTIRKALACALCLTTWLYNHFFLKRWSRTSVFSGFRFAFSKVQVNPGCRNQL